MVFFLVPPKGRSWCACGVTQVAWQTDSCNMVCFNVIQNRCVSPFLTTLFANRSFHWAEFSSNFSCDYLFGFFHHRFHYFRQVTGVCRKWELTIAICRELSGCSSQFSIKHFCGDFIHILFKDVLSRFILWFAFIRNVFSLLSYQTFQLKLFSNDKEGIKICLTYSCFAVVDKVKNSRKIFWTQPPHVNQWVPMFVHQKKFPEEGTLCCKEHLKVGDKHT